MDGRRITKHNNNPKINRTRQNRTGQDEFSSGMCQSGRSCSNNNNSYQEHGVDEWVLVQVDVDVGGDDKPETVILGPDNTRLPDGEQMDGSMDIRRENNNN